MNDTNNAAERAIARSKVRYKTMRGYQSMDGMKNGVVLTQWLYSGEDDEHDLAEVMVARASPESLPKQISQIRLPFVEQSRQPAFIDTSLYL